MNGVSGFTHSQCPGELDGGSSGPGGSNIGDSGGGGEEPLVGADGNGGEKMLPT